MTTADGDTGKQPKRPPAPRTVPRDWTDQDLAALADASPSREKRKEPDDGYLTVNRRALHDLLAQQEEGRPPTHAQASLLLRLLARSDWRRGSEGLVLGTRSEVRRLVGYRTDPAFDRVRRALGAAGLVDELRTPKAIVGYEIPADVYDWLTHADRPPMPDWLAAAGPEGNGSEGPGGVGSSPEQDDKP